MRLGIVNHPAPVQLRGNDLVVILGEQLTESLAEIPQESLGARRIADDPAGQRRKPPKQRVPMAGGEFFGKMLRPVLAPRFPAVIQHGADTAPAHFMSAPTTEPIASRYRT